MRSSLACAGILCLAIFLADSQGQAPIDGIVQENEIHVHPIQEPEWADIVPEEEVASDEEILLETKIEDSIAEAAAKKVPFSDTALGKATAESEKPDHSRAAELRRLKKAFGSAPIPAILRPLEKPKAFGSAGPKPLMKWQSIHEPYPQFPPPVIPRYISGETDDEEDKHDVGKNSLGCNKLLGCNPPAEAICKDTAPDCAFVVKVGDCANPEASKGCTKSCGQCPQGIPPATWEQATVGPGGHLYLGPSRRRVGAGFGRRRANKISKAVKKLLTKKQIKKLEPKPDPATLKYSRHAILRAAAPGNDGRPIIHVKPKAPKKKKPKKKVGPKVRPSLTKPTGSALRAAAKSVEKKATAMMPKAIAKAFAKAQAKQDKPAPTPPPPPPKPFVYTDAKERAAKWASKKEGEVVKKDHA